MNTKQLINPALKTKWMASSRRSDTEPASSQVQSRTRGTWREGGAKRSVGPHKCLRQHINTGPRTAVPLLILFHTSSIHPKQFFNLNPPRNTHYPAGWLHLVQSASVVYRASGWWYAECLVGAIVPWGTVSFLTLINIWGRPVCPSVLLGYNGVKTMIGTLLGMPQRYVLGLSIEIFDEDY